MTGTGLLDELIARIDGLPPKQREKLVREAIDLQRVRRWVPNPGPQMDAYDSVAEETLFGGEPGGGKSDLGLGLGLTSHRRTLALRRFNKDAGALGDRLIDILGSNVGYSLQPHRWRGDGRLIEFGGCEQEKDKQRYKGKPHDLKFFDELADFLESQYVFIITWNRTTIAGQRCRIVAATNPPTTPEGQWIVRRWAPWLDQNHPRPAKSGELRWFITTDAGDTEVEGPGEYPVEGRRHPVKATSRTFIRSKLDDNPDLGEEYGARVDAMPGAIGKAYRDGDFTVGQEDGDWQVIPTAWIIAAQERWKPEGGREFALTAMALDPAGGGRDSAELAWRHGGWYAPLVTAKGAETADGSASAATVVKHRRDAAPVVVDVGGGYGGAVCLRLDDNGIFHHKFNGAASPTPGAKTKDGSLSFVNKRAEAWWRFREELDPDQEGGSAIALPPDSELRADLAAPTYRLRPNGIQIEDKAEIRKRIGRSPGKGDAVVMCMSEGNRAVVRNKFSSNQKPQLISGRAPRRR